MTTATMQRALSARRLIGHDVQDARGEHVGEVEDLILDMRSWSAQWAIVSAGGFLGMGEHHFIMPVGALRFSGDSGQVMLGIERSRLKNAPTFDKDHAPDFSDEQWARSVYAYYGVGEQGGQGMPGQGQGMTGQGYEQGQEQQGMAGQGQQGMAGQGQQGMAGQGYEQGQEQQGGTTTIVRERVYTEPTGGEEDTGEYPPEGERDRGPGGDRR